MSLFSFAVRFFPFVVSLFLLPRGSSSCRESFLFCREVFSFAVSLFSFAVSLFLLPRVISFAVTVVGQRNIGNLTLN